MSTQVITRQITTESTVIIPEVLSYAYQSVTSEGNNCSDFCHQRLVLPVQLRVYSVPQQMKQGHMSTTGTSENVHSSFIMDLNLERPPHIPSPSEWVNKLVHSCNGIWVSSEQKLPPLALSRVPTGVPNTDRMPLRHYRCHSIGEQGGTSALGWDLRAALVLPYEAQLHTCPAPIVLCPAQMSDNPNVYLGTNIV